MRLLLAVLVGSALLLALVGSDSSSAVEANPEFPLSPAAAEIDVVSNGLFETGDLSPWQVYSNVTSMGDWFVSPGPIVPLSGRSLDPPPEGTYQAFTDQDNQLATLILYQDIAIPVTSFATFNLTYWIKNDAADYDNAGSLDWDVGSPNQHIRIDIMDPAAPVDDVGVGVLQNLFITTPGLATTISATVLATDLSPYSGQTIRLRIAQVTNQDLMSVGIDAVSLKVSHFSDVATILPALEFVAADWGDYDNDGDLDLLVTGEDNSSARYAGLFRNDNGTLAEVSAGIVGLSQGTVDWGDFDGDSDLDVLLTGRDVLGQPRSRIYRNDSGSLNLISSGLVGVWASAADWGDYDNDGDLDVLITGVNDLGTPISFIYENNGGAFTNIAAGLPGVRYGAVAWADYDGDGDLDFVLAGEDNTSAEVTRIYRNVSGSFTDIVAGLPSVARASVDWGDQDNDGDPELLLAGWGTVSGFVAAIYEYSGGTFTDIGAGIVGGENGAVAWGDYDNDGDRDVLITGRESFVSDVTRIYENSASIYTDIGAGFPGLANSMVAWGDYDNDGDLDFVLFGADAAPTRFGALYENNATTPNQSPSAPTNLSVGYSGTEAYFSWSPASDPETAEPGLTYNLRIGTSPGGDEISSSMASGAGYRRIVRAGNTTRRIHFWNVDLQEAGTYYWSVQAVDAAYAGSPFAAEQSFDLITFDEVASGLEGIESGALAWGDYDNDNDLDLLLTGMNPSSVPVASLYQNTGGVFTPIATGLPGVHLSSVNWGDYDNDDDLDILITGYTGAIGTGISRVYQNSGGTFVDIVAGLPGSAGGTSIWGDYDNDGDLDILLTGRDNSSNAHSEVYENDVGVFAPIGAGLLDVKLSAAAWGDYDSDGDLDLLLIGEDDATVPHSRIYENDGGTFTDIGAGLDDVSRGDVAWGDYDNDGDLDVLLMGSGGGRKSVVYQNSGGVFTDIGAGLTPLAYGSASWGDYDSDGDLDILLTGENSSSDPISELFRNDAGAFNTSFITLTGVEASAAGWADYDDDGDLDLVLAGIDASPTPVAILYEVDDPTPNTVPAAPTNLSVGFHGKTADFHWDPASDAQTPATGLTYNLRVGTTPGGSEITSAMASLSTGYRRTVQFGDAAQSGGWRITLPQGGTYYWSIQAVDGGFAGSPFATEESFDLITFTDVGATIAGARASGSTDWGDYDGDGDLDLLITGYSDIGTSARIYRNDAGNFVDIEAGFVGVHSGAVAWGDYDGDGDLDVLLTGRNNSTGVASVIYRNDGGAFVDIGAGLEGVVDGAVAWGDYDNDGDLDVLLSGETASSDYISRIYRNDDGNFFDISAGLEGVRFSSVAWGDYDNDGDLDILVAGSTFASAVISRIYENQDGSFQDIAAGLQGVYWGSADWGDCDNDGDLDVLLMGAVSGSIQTTAIYTNEAGVFVDLGVDMAELANGDADFGDYDNDGDLDVVLVGRDNTSTPRAHVYVNNWPSFDDIGAGLTEVYEGTCAWGDYDNDGDLDIVITGDDILGTKTAIIYENTNPTANTLPTTPANPTVLVDGHIATFGWDAASDAETPAPGLTYNLRIGTMPGGSEVAPGMADPATGYRRVVQLGNANHNPGWSIDLPFLPSFDWSVQSQDAAFAGSPFGSEQEIYFAPRLAAIEDIDNDQGRWVRLRISRSELDNTGASEYSVSSYGVWRRVEDISTAVEIVSLGKSVPLLPLEAQTDELLVPLEQGIASLGLIDWQGRYFATGSAAATAASALPPGTWELVGSYPAAQQSEYLYVAPTLEDSTDAGVFWSAFVITAHTVTPAAWLASDPDSGYSVDNLIPNVPASFRVTGSTGDGDVELAWDESIDHDFRYFNLYRAETDDFTPDETNRIAQLTETDYVDPEALKIAHPFYYKLTAVDFAGNESEAALATTATTAIGNKDLPTVFALHPVAPNPIRGTAMIQFDLPVSSPVTLRLYDARGRLVRTAFDAVVTEAGRHSWSWNGSNDDGARVGAGMYFYDFMAGEFRTTRKLIVLD